LTAPTITGSITDPEFRRRRAAHAAKTRTSVDHYIEKVVEAAPTLTADQVERLRSLLAPVEEVGPDAG
jgi:hypothetical protein